MENHLFNLKFTSKQLVRQSKKCEKNEKAQKLKLKQAIEKGNLDGSRIYAQNAIREKNQALNYLRLASRIDAVASRVETALRMKSVTNSMANIVKGMDKTLQTMDMDKITAIMDKFESQFEDLDVQSSYIENSMSQSTALTTPTEEVDALISQVAEEHGLNLATQMKSTAPERPEMKVSTDVDQDDLTERLNRLRQMS